MIIKIFQRIFSWHFLHIMYNGTQTMTETPNKGSFQWLTENLNIPESPNKMWSISRKGWKSSINGLGNSIARRWRWKSRTNGPIRFATIFLEIFLKILIGSNFMTLKSTVILLNMMAGNFWQVLRDTQTVKTLSIRLPLLVKM